MFLILLLILYCRQTAKNRLGGYYSTGSILFKYAQQQNCSVTKNQSISSFPPFICVFWCPKSQAEGWAVHKSFPVHVPQLQAMAEHPELRFY